MPGFRLLTTMVFISVFIISCGKADLVKFVDPQPTFERAVPEFDKKITGTYRCTSDTDKILTVGQFLVILDERPVFSASRSEIEADSTYNININNDQEIIDAYSKEGWTVKIVKDSVFLSKPMRDTIFLISENLVLKKFRGDYFLNYRLNDGYWNMKVMYEKHDTLYIDIINPSPVLQDYNYVSKNEIGSGDSIKQVEYVLNPDKKEFKRLLGSGMVDHQNKYIKVKPLKK